MIPDTTIFMFWYWKQTAVGNPKAGLHLESYKLVLPARSELEQTGLGTGSVCYCVWKNPLYSSASKIRK